MALNDPIIQGDRLIIPPVAYRISSTRLLDFDRCFRFGLFKHIMGFKPAKPELSLEFGAAWHDGLAHYAREGFTEEAKEQAKAIFTERFRSKFSVESDTFNEPKTPHYAHVGFDIYHQQYGNMPEYYEIIAVEIADRVKLTDDIEIEVKLDLVVQDKTTKEIIPIDHKTSKSSSAAFTQIYTRSLQFMNYFHAARAYFGKDNVQRFWVDRFLVQKSKQTITRIPVYFGKAMLALWYRETVAKVRSIYANIEALKQQWKNPLLDCFYGREAGCTAFFRICPYYDYCIGYPNPLQSPIWDDIEYKIERYDPLQDNE